MEELAKSPYSLAQVKVLKGAEGYRLRVGDWRIIYLIETQKFEIWIVKIAARGQGGLCFFASLSLVRYDKNVSVMLVFLETSGMMSLSIFSYLLDLSDCHPALDAGPRKIFIIMIK